ncbi:hypothetical protein SD71_15955 [Cohnella kolymensis]|uniref:Uncharacterized protein n=1 Tax=Cohnella kolymensis TaxID=1590652 RepID=A0ABR5A245_9BACL|nr:hypothetical protein [Cohnella kolymensis]KIL35129.1 hypothetical protein SD71_15955 [Cohnella kolymensis]
MQKVEVQDPHGWIPANVPNGQLFLRADQVAGVVRLSQAEGHLFQADDGDWIISAEGYRAINIVAGIRSIETKTMILPDGREVGNPYIEYDEKTNTPQKFWAYHVTVGRGLDGKPFVSAATVMHDIRLLFLMELNAAIALNKDAGRLCTFDQLDEDERKTGYFEPFHGNMGIYARTECADIIPIVSNFIRRKNYGEREASTLAWKSSLKKHPCMPPVKVKAQLGVASVLVANFLSDFSDQQLHELSRELLATGNVEGASVSNTFIDTQEETSEISLLSHEGGPRF